MNWVDKIITRSEELDYHIESSFQEIHKISIDSEEKKEIFLVFHPTSNIIKNNNQYKKQDFTGEFNISLNNQDEEPIIRKITISAKLCYSHMRINQRSINFGNINEGSKLDMKIYIHNVVYFYYYFIECYTISI